MTDHILAGFGFGPIQSGLFVAEAYKSGNFSRMIIAEIDGELVEAVRQNGGCYYVNIATQEGMDILKVQGLEMLNPTDATDQRQLNRTLAEATEITTALPSVEFYEKGDPSVAGLIADGIKNNVAPAKIIYTGENNNHAAEILQQSIQNSLGRLPAHVQFLNTVIGKMSRVVNDPAEVKQLGLKPIAKNLGRAFLVEEFNKIMVTRMTIDGFRTGIDTFAEKTDLLPFEEAKLYGHNAIHALLAYLGYLKGYTYMKEIRKDNRLMDIAQKAFIDESGKALTRKYAYLNEWTFTPEGYKEYAEDLLIRMTNPYLADTIERAARDPIRKLHYNDRLFGSMNLALEQDIEPINIALGTMAAVATVVKQAQQGKIHLDTCDTPWQKLDEQQFHQIVRSIWSNCTSDNAGELISRVYAKKESLLDILK